MPHVNSASGKFSLSDGPLSDLPRHHPREDAGSAKGESARAVGSEVGHAARGPLFTVYCNTH